MQRHVIILTLSLALGTIFTVSVMVQNVNSRSVPFP